MDPSSSSPPLSPPVHRDYEGDDDVEGINEDLTTITIDKSKVSKTKRKASDSPIKSGSDGKTTEPTTSTSTSAMFTTSASISTMFKEDRDVSILFY